MTAENNPTKSTEPILTKPQETNIDQTATTDPNIALFDQDVTVKTYGNLQEPPATVVGQMTTAGG